MTDTSGPAPLRVTKADANAIAKRLRNHLASEHGWNGTYQQSIVLTAKLLGWRNQETMAANYADTRLAAQSLDRPTTDQSDAALHAHSDFVTQAIIERSAWRLIDLAETENREARFPFLTVRLNTDLKAFNEYIKKGINEQLQSDVTLSDHMIASLPKMSKEEFATLTGRLFFRHAVELAGFLWYVRPGYQKALSHLERDFRELFDVLDGPDSSPRPVDPGLLDEAIKYLIRSAAILLVLTAAKKEQPLAEPSNSPSKASPFVTSLDDAAGWLGKLLETSSPARALIRSKLAKPKFTGSFSGKKAAHQLLFWAIKTAEDLWMKRQNYLAHLEVTDHLRNEWHFLHKMKSYLQEATILPHTAEKEAASGSLAEQIDILRVETAARLFRAGIKVLPHGDFADAMHTENSGGLHPLLSVEAEVAKALQHRSDLIAFIRDHYKEWSSLERRDNRYRAATAMVNEALPMAEHLWTRHRSRND